MNLFRSEESVRSWTDFEVKTEKSIKPVMEWAAMFQARLFQRRLDDDFVEKSEEYTNKVLSSLAEAIS
jgi:hypothetical protein